MITETVSGQHLPTGDPMAHVALISCNITQEPFPVYPLGMSMVAEAARKKGHVVSEWDMNVDGKDETSIRNFIQDNNPDYVGLSLRNVDSANFNKPDAYIQDYKLVVNTIRQVTDAPIILGGSAYTIFPDRILQELGADYGITGEGEAAFCHLLDQLRDDPDTAYPIYYNFPFIDATEMGSVKRNPELVRYYLSKGGMINIQTKRGCPHRCAYCSYPILEGRQYRFREPGAIADEIEMLKRDYGTDYFAITDSVFNDASGHYLTIAEEFIRRKLDTPWMCYLRPDDFTEEEVRLLKRSGLSAIEWGTDCATDTTLKAMRKAFTWDQVVHSNNLFAENGMYNAHFIIFGGPGETHETVDEGLKNLLQLEKCVIFAGIGVRIFPGTAVHEWALEESNITPDQDLLPPTYYFSGDIDTDVIHQKILAAFKNRLDRIYPDGQHVETAKSFHAMGYRGPAWDLLLKRNITR